MLTGGKHNAHLTSYVLVDLEALQLHLSPLITDAVFDMTSNLHPLSQIKNDITSPAHFTSGSSVSSLYYNTWQQW